MLDKNEAIKKIDIWLFGLDELYKDSEVGMNCLISEWKELKKEIRK